VDPSPSKGDNNIVIIVVSSNNQYILALGLDIFSSLEQESSQTIYLVQNKRCFVEI